MTILAKTSAPGKVILFGEHFVVYGATAIAATIDKRTVVTIEKLSDNPKVILELVNFDFKSEPLNVHLPEALSAGAEVQRSYQAFRKVWLELGLEKIHNFELLVTVTSELPPGKGMGSSASFSVALCSALLALRYYLKEGVEKIKNFDISKEYEFLNNLAFQSECVFHGKPSGIDNEVCLRGGAVQFSRKSDRSLIKSLDVSNAINIIIVDTKKSRNTSKVVADVKEFQIRHPEIFENIFKAAQSVSEAAVNGLSSFEEITELVRANQGLLYAIGVSDSLLEQIGLAAEHFGLPWKLTGAGRGGNALIFFSNSFTDLNGLCETLSKRGFDACVTKLGTQGLIFHT